jgi:hypothetical protein
MALSAAAAAMIGASAVHAEEYPSKTIEVVTHAGAGGGTDVTTRMMMLRARRELKQDMVVVNKRGGGGVAAMDYYLGVPADGYTILTFTIGHAAELAKGKTKMTLDDIRPIARGTDDPQILMVRCGVYADAADFVAKQKEAPIIYGTTHVGNIDDVSAFMFTVKGDMKTPKILPFDGGGELATQLVAGAVDAAAGQLLHRARLRRAQGHAGRGRRQDRSGASEIHEPHGLSGLPDVGRARFLVGGRIRCLGQSDQHHGHRYGGRAEGTRVHQITTAAPRRPRPPRRARSKRP